VLVGFADAVGAIAKSVFDLVVQLRGFDIARRMKALDNREAAAQIKAAGKQPGGMFGGIARGEEMLQRIRQGKRELKEIEAERKALNDSFNRLSKANNAFATLADTIRKIFEDIRTKGLGQGLAPSAAARGDGDAGAIAAAIRGRPTFGTAFRPSLYAPQSITSQKAQPVHDAVLDDTIKREFEKLDNAMRNSPQPAVAG
jgi:hypothetical protein